MSTGTAWGLLSGHVTLSQNEIKELIPYDEPFLFISTLTFLGEDSAEAEYRIDPDAWYLRGHFVGNPVMPGALIAEGLGQLGTILVRSRIPDHHQKDILAYCVKNMRFKRMAFPRETLTYRVKLAGHNDVLAKLKATASIDGCVVAEGRLVQAIVDKQDLWTEGGNGRQVRKIDPAAGP